MADATPKVTGWSRGMFRARAGIWERELMDNIEAIFQGFVSDLTEDMMAGAHTPAKPPPQPWQDHTGNARQGLLARTERRTDEVDLVLEGEIKEPGAVQYVTFLELSNQGRFATIDPTFQAYESEITRAIEGLAR